MHTHIHNGRPPHLAFGSAFWMAATARPVCVDFFSSATRFLARCACGEQRGESGVARARFEQGPGAVGRLHAGCQRQAAASNGLAVAASLCATCAPSHLVKDDHALARAVLAGQPLRNLPQPGE